MSLYVYAITQATHPLHLDKLEGVGESPTAVRAVRGDSLCAVVSETPDDLQAKRRDIEAHHKVQEQLWEEGATLPMHFGLVAPDEDALKAVLEERAEQFTRRLQELQGRVEFDVKATLNEEVVLRDILEESEQLRQLNEVTREGGGTYEQRLAFGQRVAQEVQVCQEKLAQEIASALRPLAGTEQLAEPSGQYFLNAAYLVDRDRAEEFAEAGRRVAERHQEQVELRLLGPLPAYSFV